MYYFIEDWEPKLDNINMNSPYYVKELVSEYQEDLFYTLTKQEKIKLIKDKYEKKYRK